MRPIDSLAGPRGDAWLDRLLVSTYASDPPPAVLGAMDARIAGAIRAGTTGVGRGRRWRRRAGWTLLAAAVIGVTTGAGALLLRPFEGWSSPQFDVVWAEGARLDLARVVDGYEVTIVRGHADAGQVILAVEVEDLEQRRETTQVASFLGLLVDDDGREYPGMMSTTGPVHAHQAAELWYYTVPDPAPTGMTGFTLRIDTIQVRDQPAAADPWRDVPGPWVFDFRLPFGHGVDLAFANQSATVGGITIHLERLVIGATTVRVGIRIETDDHHIDSNVVETVVRRGNVEIPIGIEEMGEGGRRMLIGTEGVPDPSGTWTISIGQLVAGGDDRPRGPWTFEVTVP